MGRWEKNKNASHDKKRKLSKAEVICESHASPVHSALRHVVARTPSEKRAGRTKRTPRPGQHVSVAVHTESEHKVNYPPTADVLLNNRKTSSSAGVSLLSVGSPGPSMPLQYLTSSAPATICIMMSITIKTLGVVGDPTLSKLTLHPPRILHSRVEVGVPGRFECVRTFEVFGQPLSAALALLRLLLPVFHELEKVVNALVGHARAVGRQKVAREHTEAGRAELSVPLPLAVLWLVHVVLPHHGGALTVLHLLVLRADGRVERRE